MDSLVAHLNNQPPPKGDDDAIRLAQSRGRRARPDTHNHSDGAGSIMLRRKIRS
jgi:hypothetical protein